MVGARGTEREMEVVECRTDPSLGQQMFWVSAQLRWVRDQRRAYFYFAIFIFDINKSSFPTTRLWPFLHWYQIRSAWFGDCLASRISKTRSPTREEKSWAVPAARPWLQRRAAKCWKPPPMSARRARPWSKVCVAPDWFLSDTRWHLSSVHSGRILDIWQISTNKVSNPWPNTQIDNVHPPN